jgi:hypothetical protein
MGGILVVPDHALAHPFKSRGQIRWNSWQSGRSNKHGENLQCCGASVSKGGAGRVRHGRIAS